MLTINRDYLDMIQGQWLSNASFTTVHSGANLSRVKSMGQTGDFQAGDLSRAVNTEDINQITVQSWLAKAQGRKSTLVFCVDLAHVAALTATFRRFGIDARFVTSETAKQERANLLEGFKNMDYPILLNCGIFTEGTDIPNIDCVLLARPTKSRNLLVQMIGRGLRLHAGKQDCHIIDMVASLETGIVSTPTLLGLDPSEILETADMSEVAKKRAQKSERDRVQDDAYLVPTSRPSGRLSGNVTFTHYESIDDLMEDTSGERFIREMSPFAWVQLGDNRFILSNSNGDLLRINWVEERFEVVLVSKLPAGVAKVPYSRPRELAKVDTIEDALHAADTFASKRFPFRYISKSAEWRKLPASEAQVSMINKTRGEGKKFRVGQLQKGRATDMITKIKFGGLKTRFAAMEQDKKRLVKIDDKRIRLAERLEREQVRVGPVE